MYCRAAFLLLVGGVGAVILRPPVAPRGWNSYDFGNGTATYGPPNTTVLWDSVAGVRELLQPHGYEYICIDGGWYGNGTLGDIDMHGRPIPRRDIYPDLNGSWTTVGDKLHGMGLKFGMWMTLGIPTAAVEKKLPILGTNYTAGDIVVRQGGQPVHACPWNPDVVKVNTSHPGGMAYYSSVVGLWEEWGLDYVTLDCVFAADMAMDDLVAYSTLMEESKHSFILSLSPGDYATAEQVTLASKYATMARVTPDYWHNWHMTFDHFEVAERLGNLSGPDQGFYINMDKLPFSKVRGQPDYDPPFWSLVRRTIVTLWSLVHSPLMFGGDIRTHCKSQSPPCGVTNSSLPAVTNPNVLHAHADMRGATLLFDDGITKAWMAHSSADRGARYIAVFNTLCGIPRVPDPPCQNQSMQTTVTFPSLGLQDGTPYTIFNLWNNSVGGVATHAVTVEVASFDVAFLHLTPVLTA